MGKTFFKSFFKVRIAQNRHQNKGWVYDQCSSIQLLYGSARNGHNKYYTHFLRCLYPKLLTAETVETISNLDLGAQQWQPGIREAWTNVLVAPAAMQCKFLLEIIMCFLQPHFFLIWINYQLLKSIGQLSYLALSRNDTDWHLAEQEWRNNDF